METITDYRPTGDIPPPSKQSPAFKLFHWHYQCIVPANATYDVNDLEYFGIPTTGDRDWDLQMSSADTDRSYSAADMAAMVANGAPLSLLDPRDAVAIYLTIFEHICDWRDHVRNTLVVRPIPLEGLFQFNQLARLMLTIARRYGYQNQISNKVVKTGRWFEANNDESAVLGKITHNEAVLSEILTAAQSRGQSIKNYAIALKTEDATSKVGSMWGGRNKEK